MCVFCGKPEGRKSKLNPTGKKSWCQTRAFCRRDVCSGRRVCHPEMSLVPRKTKPLKNQLKKRIHKSRSALFWWGFITFGGANRASSFLKHALLSRCASNKKQLAAFSLHPRCWYCKDVRAHLMSVDWKMRFLYSGYPRILNGICNLSIPTQTEIYVARGRGRAMISRVPVSAAVVVRWLRHLCNHCKYQGPRISVVQ